MCLADVRGEKIGRGDGGVKRTIAHSFVITLWFGRRSGRRHSQARVGRITTGQRHNGHTAAKYGCHSSTDLLILFRVYKVLLFTGAATALCKWFSLEIQVVYRTELWLSSRHCFYHYPTHTLQSRESLLFRSSSLMSINKIWCLIDGDFLQKLLDDNMSLVANSAKPNRSCIPYAHQMIMEDINSRI